MIKIAICEDNEIERTILVRLVSSLVRERGLQFELSDFVTGEEMIAKSAGKSYDLMFLDVIMGEKNGIDIGKIVREIDKETEIVYCTSSADFAIAAYEVHAMGYMLKPYEPAKLGALIDYFIQMHPQENLKIVKVKSQRKELVIPYKDIICLESENKIVNFHTTTHGVVKVYNKLDYYEHLLSDERFLRCHQSYLINMQYVAGCMDTDFIMLNDKIVPIHKKGRKLILHRYQEYYAKSVSE